jgi:hypothetical protein
MTGGPWVGRFRNGGEPGGGGEGGGGRRSGPGQTGGAGGGEESGNGTPPHQDPTDFDRAAQALRAAYLEHLGREATNEDIQGWWSGQYGWGAPGIEGLPGWLRGIEQSPEAQARAGPETETETTGVPPRTGQAPPGWDQRKWDDPEHHTAKYDAAAFLQGLTKPSDIAAMVRSDDFQARFRGATFNDKDKIDFGSNLEGGNRIGVIDVLMRADQGADTSGGLWWGADGGAAPTPAPAGAAPTPAGAAPTPAGAAPAQPGWTQPPGSPLFNPPATQGPPSLGYGMGPGGGGGTMGQMITPYNPLATYSPVPYTPAAPFAQNPFAAAEPYTSPTLADYSADPGYQFRFREGQAALERSGAARGVTNTGGTLRDITDYGQRAASQEISNVDRRMQDIYEMNERNRYDAYQANYGNAMDAYNLNERNRYQGYTTNELARWGQNQEAEARRSGAYTTNLGAYQDQQQYGLKQQGQGFDQSFRNWQEQYNQGRWNATDTFNRMYPLATT